jgi:dipeptidyl-peptidase-4
MMRPVNRNLCLHLTILASSLAATVPCWAQPRAVTAADYARAEKFMNYNTNGLMVRSAVQANWLPDERMWYRVTTAEGS